MTTVLSEAEQNLNDALREREAIAGDLSLLDSAMEEGRYRSAIQQALFVVNDASRLVARLSMYFAAKDEVTP